MIEQPQRNNLLLGLGLGFLLGASAASFVWLTRETRGESAWLHDYGTALATLTANQAIDSILNHDLVSLQVILQGVIDHPRVLSASIRDVENRLLVQAGLGHEQLPLGSILEFSQPIPLSDSEAGYVSVSVSSPGGTQATIRYVIIAVGCTLLLLLSLLIRLTRVSSPTKRNALQDEQEVESAMVADEQNEQPVIATAMVVISLLNRDTLAEQLSSKVFESVIEEFETLIVECSALYGGKSLSEALAAGMYQLEFPSRTSADEARFRAVCFSALLQKCDKPKKFPFDYNFLVFLAGEKTGVAITEPACIAVNGKGHPIGRELSSRIASHQDQWGLVVVTGFPAVIQQQIDAHYLVVQDTPS